MATQRDSWGWGGGAGRVASGDRNRLPQHKTPYLGEAAIEKEAGERL